MRILLSLLTLAVALGAEDPWDKVRQLKSGTELRIYKKGVEKPLAAKMDEATPDHLKVVIKNAQVSIAKKQIDRIDAKPVATRQKTTETKTTTKMQSPDPTQPGQGSPGITDSTSISTGYSRSGVSYETVYRRPADK